MLRALLFVFRSPYQRRQSCPTSDASDGASAGSRDGNRRAGSDRGRGNRRMTSASRPAQAGNNTTARSNNPARNNRGCLRRSPPQSMRPRRGRTPILARPSGRPSAPPLALVLRRSPRSTPPRWPKLPLFVSCPCPPSHSPYRATRRPMRWFREPTPRDRGNFYDALQETENPQCPRNKTTIFALGRSSGGARQPSDRTKMHRMP